MNEPYGIQDIDTSVNNLIKELKLGKIDGIYLLILDGIEAKEDKGEWQERLANQLAGLADIYVNKCFRFMAATRVYLYYY